MLELGDTSRTAHAGLKDHIEKNDIDAVFMAGPEMSALADVLDADRIGATADSAAALLPAVLSGLRAGDVVTVKASNGTGLGRIVAALIDSETVSHAANGN
jgi:UDP-N-acetylmuramoyl-tripeptide--D-alanyl-D-alanine ligase